MVWDISLCSLSKERNPFLVGESGQVNSACVIMFEFSQSVSSGNTCPVIKYFCSKFCDSFIHAHTHLLELNGSFPIGEIPNNEPKLLADYYNTLYHDINTTQCVHYIGNAWWVAERKSAACCSGLQSRETLQYKIQ